MDSRSIVFIVLDTVRKDYFQEYAPRLAERAEISVDSCRAVSSWTVPSHASILTGQLPHQHGIHAGSVDFSSISRSDTFLSELPEHRTVGVSANAYFSSAFGVDGLFDEFHDIAPSVAFSDGMYLREFSSTRNGVLRGYDYLRQILDHDQSLKSFVNAASHGISSLKPSFLPRWDDDGARAVSRRAVKAVRATDEPYVLFLNYMDAHAPFAPTRRYDSDLYSVPRGWSSDEIDVWEFNTGNAEQYERDIEYYRSLYGAAVDYLDRTVTELIDDIQAASNGEVTFVITSDHGENLGYEADSNLIDHKSSLSEGLLHVPLLIVNPPTNAADSDGYVSQLDIPDLLTSLAGGQLSLQRRSMIPAELIGLGAQDPPLEPADYEFFDRMIRAVYQSGTKVVWDSLGNGTQYNMIENRSCFQVEQAALSQISQGDSEFFDSGIDEYKSSTASRQNSSETSEAVKSRLEDLGYR